MQWLFLVVGLVLGAAVSGLIVRSRWRDRTAELRARLGAQADQAAAAGGLRDENERLRIELARRESERTAAAEKAEWIDRAQETLRETFTALASEALTTNAEQLLARTREQLAGVLEQVCGDWGTQREALRGLVSPLEKSVSALDEQIRALEEKREKAYGSLEQHLRSLGDAQSDLRTTATTLAQAMTASTARGRWGELQLRRIVELAGMVRHVDFQEQPATADGRPDMLVHLPNGGVLPVDAKASAAAYLAAIELDGDRRRAKLEEHAKAMRARILELSRRDYWAQFERAPEIVVMFVPLEPALSAAFDQDPDLLEYGVRQRVLIASPVTLLALLRTVAFGWQQYQIAENARRVAEQGRELYKRLITLISHLQGTGRRLASAVDAYNATVGSYERMLLPAARRLGELIAASDEPPDVGPVETPPRLPADPPAD